MGRGRSENVVAATGLNEWDMTHITPHIDGVVRKPGDETFIAWRDALEPILTLKSETVAA